jgi:hypothetical protein
MVTKCARGSSLYTGIHLPYCHSSGFTVTADDFLILIDVHRNEPPCVRQFGINFLANARADPPRYLFIDLYP